MVEGDWSEQLQDVETRLLHRDGEITIVVCGRFRGQKELLKPAGPIVKVVRTKS